LDRRDRRHAEMRSRIVEQAWAEAEQTGIAELTLRALARRLGMRAPSLYEYVDSKGAIYDLLFADGYRRLREFLGDLPRTGDRLTDLRVGMERWLGFCAASLPRYQLMFTRAIPGWEPSAEAYAVSQAASEQMARHFEALGVRDVVALELFQALSAGLAAQQAANDPDGDRYRRLVPDATAMFVQYLDDRNG
jgi:AcrR family transcriptional regulator